MHPRSFDAASLRRPGWIRFGLSGSFALGAWLLAAGCLYDASDRCGPDQELSGTQACVCRAGLVLVGTNCVQCPEHEHELDGACSCDEGYERPAQGQACMLVVEAGLGAACGPTKPCVDSVYDTCKSGGIAGPYCTKLGCESSEDCDEGYGCQVSEDESFCEREPLGLGDACDTSADCAGGDADYCESNINHRCIVQGCSVSQNDCFADFDCCDLSKLGLPGLPASVCAPKGDCP